MTERNYLQVVGITHMDGFPWVMTNDEVRAEMKRIEREANAARYRKQIAVLRLHDAGRDYIDCTG